MKMPKLNFKVLFDNDKFLWFLSFLFAFMLWFTVVNTIDTTADRSITNVPVSFDSSSESLEAMGLDGQGGHVRRTERGRQCGPSGPAGSG